MNRLMARLAFLLILVPSVNAFAAMQKGDYVAVIGDSITEQKKYSLFIEEYLLMCKPEPDLLVTQFGWSGETSWGFERRMDNDMLRFKPTIATTCFGMNDGGYSPMTDEKAKHYRDAQTSIVQKMKKAGVRWIVVGSPGCVDVNTFRNHNREQAEMYNKTLAALRDIAKDVAEKEGVQFADVFDPMHEAMTKAEERYGSTYHVAGGDGVHPDNNGHLIMAYAFLKALGCKGEIGTITVDLSGNSAQATEGHKVLGVRDHSVEIESTRYPFCFFGDDLKSPSSTRGILEFVPFNQDLNRFMLVVKNASADRLRVSWGDESKEFSSADLEKGINLAAEFANNPFREPFQQVQEQIRRKQDLETPLVKEVINQFPQVTQRAPGEAQALEKALQQEVVADKDLAAAAGMAVVPVKHTIKIEPVK